MRRDFPQAITPALHLAQRYEIIERQDEALVLYEDILKNHEDHPKTLMNKALDKSLPVTDRVQESLAVTLRGCEELIPEGDWVRKLARSEATGVPLRIKLGLDPTAPDIHIGHTVVLNKLRQLQDLGHTVIFLIGDFTTLIGDPSGRSDLRNMLTVDDIDRNVQSIRRQMERFLVEALGLEAPTSGDPFELAMAETERAIALVHSGQTSADLRPVGSAIRRYQHEMVRQANLVSHSYGREPYRHVRIFNTARND